ARRFSIRLSYRVTATSWHSTSRVEAAVKATWSAGLLKRGLTKADDSDMLSAKLARTRLSQLSVLVLLPICCSLWSPHESVSQEEPQLFPERSIARCEVLERPANQRDIPLTRRIPVLAEPENWLNVPGPHGERAEGWQGRRPGYRVFDSQQHLLYSIPNV